jgi:hypothetical protein
LTWPSRFSHSSDAKRGEPLFSGRKRTPHSTQPCCSEIRMSAAGSTVSSAPQKPRQLKRTGTPAMFVFRRSAVLGDFAVCRVTSAFACRYHSMQRPRGHGRVMVMVRVGFVLGFG